MSSLSQPVMNNPTSAAAFVCVVESTEKATGNKSQDFKRQTKHESPEQDFGVTLFIRFFSTFFTYGYSRAVVIFLTFSSNDTVPETIFLIGSLVLVFRNLSLTILIFSS